MLYEDDGEEEEEEEGDDNDGDVYEEEEGLYLDAAERYIGGAIFAPKVEKFLVGVANGVVEKR